MDVLHLRMNVTDAEELADWYIDNLGFEHSWEFTGDDGTRHVMVADSNGIELQLSDTDGRTLEFGNAWDHLAVSVEDLDDALESIDHHGIVQEPETRPELNARFAFVEDPDGHVIELVQDNS